ncbi:MAG: DsbA family oxidoreductase [Clostridia bacterium]|nr:DsbA family oxidoreductase [Clostridia bacterium]
MEIVYWSDYACPYCYIGETHMKQAIRKLGLEGQVSPVMKAFELDPDASKAYVGPTVDRFARKYGLSRNAAEARIEGISQMGQAAGLDFHYAQTRYTNTLDAHRLTKLAQLSPDKSLPDRLSERLYHAYFAESLELSDHDVLLRIATEEGMDAEEVKALLSGDNFTVEVRLDEREAYRYGVHAVPYFLVNHRLAIPGALSAEQMEQVLRSAMAEEEATSDSGMMCGPEGCRIGDHLS